MDKGHFTKAAILMIFIVLVTVISWELYLRNKGYKISYDDGSALWSDKRDQVYKPNATVFIGSSRIKYDLDAETWRKVAGDEPVQLAMEGTSPRPILDDLGNDKNFKGRLIIDVTEVLFFTTSPPPRQREVTANLDFYKNNHTLAQRASFVLNRKLESNLVFLDKEFFSLAALLDKARLPPRPGVFSMPQFPVEFNRVTFDRQAYMTPLFLTDSNLQNKVKKIWEMFGSRKEPPPRGDTLQKIFASVKNSIDKIKERGGTVVFVRTPSSGPFLIGEEKGFPREQYWDKLLAYTNCPGIHFQDYPAIDHFQCPEFSHLSKQDAIVFTKKLIEILESENGWEFKNSKKVK